VRKRSTADGPEPAPVVYNGALGGGGRARGTDGAAESDEENDADAADVMADESGARPGWRTGADDG
jgi:hypothetical protein